ncbi:hypothetical protein PVLB_14665 [Pseudomonas sp. VLB120]|nr:MULTISPECIES: hypothetical protein [Pseudomonas]AGZ35717.1 hypothetical protein PVLB_14665 [Pseudomonas sp. VLB120]
MTMLDSPDSAEESPIMRWSDDRSGTVDKHSFIGMVEAGEQLIQKSFDAMRNYHHAQDHGAHPEEVERHWLLAEPTG